MPIHISNNTSIKATSLNGYSSLIDYSKETGSNSDDLSSLRVGEFQIKRGRLNNDSEPIPSIKVRLPNHLIEDRHSINQEQWETIKNSQIESFYRSLYESEFLTPQPQYEEIRKPKLEIDL
jgi:hypothetical protein